MLEARDRVGGRTVGHTFENGVRVEMGGQWIGPTHSELRRLVDELGLETFPTYDDGDGFTVLDGARHRWEGNSLGLPARAESEIGRLHQLINELAESVPLDAPWEAPDAADLDRQTVESWLTAATVDPVARAYVRAISAAIFAAESDEIPWLYFLFYVRSGGSLDYLITTAGGAQELRVSGGAHRIAAALAAALPADSLLLGVPVHEIRQDQTAVRVSYARGSVTARRAIVTLPPALAGHLAYEPALPIERNALTRSFPMGSVIKIQVLYDEPWWRRDGLSGQVLGLDEPIATTFDNSPPDGGTGVLLAFVEGEHARRLAKLSPDDRRTTVIATLERFFGRRVREAREYVELDWSTEEFTRGCYGGRPGTRILTSFGAHLREAHRRIHWAGAETSDVSSGYMDGAVRSGLRAAAEVSAAL